MKDYKILIRKYGDKQYFYDFDVDHFYPHYDLIDEINLGVMSFESIDAAYDWILDNYPDYCYGMYIMSTDGSGDFMLGAVKDAYWDEATKSVLRPLKSTEWHHDGDVEITSK